jgi:hypothetical protein
MSPLNWLGNKDLDEFAKSLAGELAQRFTLEMDRASSDKKTEKKLGTALNGVYAKAQTYRNEHKLGVYRKARIGNTFKWELKERGYSEAFVDEATKGLILSLSRN